MISVVSEEKQNEDLTLQSEGNSLCQHIDNETLVMINDRFNEVMKSEMPYLNVDLTLSGLASMIGTNTVYLSYYFNSVLGSNFNSYINERRAEHAEKLLLSDLTMTIEEIAKFSGFNSVTTMQRLFVSKNHCTPSQFRQQGNGDVVMPIVDKEQGTDLPKLGVLSNKNNFLTFTSFVVAKWPSYHDQLLNYEPSMTRKELILALLIALGYNNEQIAMAMELSPASLNVSRSRLRQKLHLRRTDSIQVMLLSLLDK
ncbi:MAG: helix-turn-helix domain-containing protein [Bacteroidaceae bacterium]|nr:helix-turn-helix domain-containing protein [Bacteroidaceae bacterium]